MRGLAPFCLLLAPLAALAVLLAGPTGAAVVGVVGGLLAVVGALLVQGQGAPRAAAYDPRRAAVRRFLLALIVGGFVLRVVLALALRQSGLNEALGGDEMTFDANGRVFAAWLDGQLPFAFQARFGATSQVGYFVLVGTSFWAFGHEPLVPVLLNCAVGALTAVPVFRIASRMGGAMAGRVAAVLVTFFPSLVLWSCLMVRDALVLFLVAWAAALSQDLLRRVRPAQLGALLAVLAALATLRTYIFLLLAGALVAAFLASIVRRPGRAALVAVVAAIGVVALVRGAGLGAEFLGEDYLARIDEQRRLNALVGSTAIALGSYDLSTPTGALAYLPVGLLHFFLAPFPWQMGGRQYLALPDIVVWYAALPAIASGAVHALRWRRSAALAPLVGGLSIGVLYALVEGNVGIIVRHRAQMVVLLLPFAGVAVARHLRSRARRRAADEARRRRIVHARVWSAAGAG